MAEIKTKLIALKQGETYTADEDGAIVITGSHTHADIIRHVVDDIGEDALYLVNEAIRDRMQPQ